MVNLCCRTIFLNCLSEKLRGPDKLDEQDGQFPDVMITRAFYKNFSGTNREKPEMLLKAYKHTAKKKR